MFYLQFDLQFHFILATLRQSAVRSKKHKNTNYQRTPGLASRPQVKGIVNKVTTMSPKKPNSAVRHIAKVTLTSTRRLTARIPGIGYICSKYNRVLVNGGRANDLPGVGYTLIRGVYDFSPVIAKKKTSFRLWNLSPGRLYLLHQKIPANIIVTFT